MNRVSDSWTAVVVTVPVRGEPVPRRAADDLAAQIDGLPDDADVSLPAGVVRALLAPHRTERTELAVTVMDTNKGVTYRTKVARGRGRVALAEVTVQPSDPLTADLSVWRVPAQALADAAALTLARHEAAASAAERPEAAVTFVGEGAVLPDPDGIPTAEQLCDALNAGETRHTIAARWHRSVARVDQWLRVARRDHPELPWPPRRRGPKPQNPTQEGK